MSELKIEAKYCKKCQKVKHLTDFYKCDGRNQLGVSSACKECFNGYTKTWREKKSAEKKAEKEKLKKEKEEKKVTDEPKKKRGRPTKNALEQIKITMGQDGPIMSFQTLPIP